MHLKNSLEKMLTFNFYFCNIVDSTQNFNGTSSSISSIISILILSENDLLYCNLILTENKLLYVNLGNDKDILSYSKVMRKLAPTVENVCKNVLEQAMFSICLFV